MLEYEGFMQVYYESREWKEATNVGAIEKDRILCSKGPEVKITHVKPGHTKLVTICPICHEDFAKAQPGSCFLSCLHWYHFDCLAKWMMNFNRCPSCNKEALELFKIQDDQSHPTS